MATLFSLAPQRCFVLLMYLFFILFYKNFIVEAQFSALAGRIFVIFVPFDRVSLRFLFSV